MSMVKVALTFRKADARNLGAMPRPVRITAVLAFASMLAGCATTEIEQACQPGEERMRTAQLFFGRNIDQPPVVSEVQFREFVAQEITPRFPTGLTVLDGGGQWAGPENRLIRDSAKVVVLVLPEKDGDAEQRSLGEVRQAYQQRFKQDAVSMVTQKACVAL